MADVDRRYKMLHRPTIYKLTGGINYGKNRMTSFYCSTYSGYRQLKLKSASRCLSSASRSFPVQLSKDLHRLPPDVGLYKGHRITYTLINTEDSKCNVCRNVRKSSFTRPNPESGFNAMKALRRDIFY